MLSTWHLCPSFSIMVWYVKGVCLNNFELAKDLKYSSAKVTSFSLLIRNRTSGSLMRFGINSVFRGKLRLGFVLKTKGIEGF